MNVQFYPLDLHITLQMHHLSRDGNGNGIAAIQTIALHKFYVSLFQYCQRGSNSPIALFHLSIRSPNAKSHRARDATLDLDRQSYLPDYAPHHTRRALCLALRRPVRLASCSPRALLVLLSSRLALVVPAPWPTRLGLANTALCPPHASPPCATPASRYACLALCLSRALPISHSAHLALCPPRALPASRYARLAICPSRNMPASRYARLALCQSGVSRRLGTLPQPSRTQTLCRPQHALNHMEPPSHSTKT